MRAATNNCTTILYLIDFNPYLPVNLSFSKYIKIKIPHRCSMEVLCTLVYNDPRNVISCFYWLTFPPGICFT